jgi:methylphosphotriester-DNA--protein-cysteine methyltransferase
MRLACLLVLMVLLMPLAFSASDATAKATAGDARVSAQIIDHSTPDHASEGMFVGSTKSNKYHYPSCRWAEKILPENEIWFSSSEDARAHGYVACGVCHPP